MSAAFDDEQLERFVRGLARLHLEIERAVRNADQLAKHLAARRGSPGNAPADQERPWGEKRYYLTDDPTGRTQPTATAGTDVEAEVASDLAHQQRTMRSIRFARPFMVSIRLLVVRASCHGATSP